MRLMRRMVVMACILSCLGCVPRQAKTIIRNKHAISKVIAQRMNDADPGNDLTTKEMKEFIQWTARDWESMDRLINNWRPKDE